MKKVVSPIGTSAERAAERRAARSAAYRAEQRRIAAYESIARLVIKHRSASQLSQKQLAQRVGTSHSAISRIETGQHATSVETLRRIATALNLDLVVNFAPIRRTVVRSSRGAGSYAGLTMAAARGKS